MGFAFPPSPSGLTGGPIAASAGTRSAMDAPVKPEHDGSEAARGSLKFARPRRHRLS